MDVIFNLFKIKYTKLDELLTKHCTTLKPNSNINLFINFESLMKKLYNSNIMEYLKVCKNKEEEIISNIINLAAHYRLFFSKNKIYSKIYFYMGFPFKSHYKNKLINPDYRKLYNEKYSKGNEIFVFSELLNNTIPIVKIIFEYIEGVYFINSNLIEPSLIPYIITKDSMNNTFNLILSKEKYDYQYVNKDFYLLNPKQENSYIIDSQNIIENVKIDNKVYNDLTVSSKYLSFILSLLGDKYRNIEKIKSIGLSGVIKSINKAIEQNKIGENVFNINILSNIIKEEYRKDLLNNFYCTDIDTQYSMLNIKDIYSITEQLIDKFDNVQLKKLNDQYFINSPIYLMELMSGNKLKNQTKSVFDV